MSSACRQELFEHDAGYFHFDDAPDLRRAPERLYPDNHIVFCLIHTRFPEGDHPRQQQREGNHRPLGTPCSKSKSTLCQSIVFLCVQGSFPSMLLVLQGFPE